MTMAVGTKNLLSALTKDCAATALREFAAQILPTCGSIEEVALALEFCATSLERSALKHRKDTPNDVNAETRPTVPDERTGNPLEYGS
jgi:hypothetical protein